MTRRELLTIIGNPDLEHGRLRATVNQKNYVDGRPLDRPVCQRYYPATLP